MSIQRREIFYDNINGIKRFWDWAMVTTTLGAMAEPFSINARFSPGTPFTNFDATDEMARVDEITNRSIHKEKLILSGGVHQLHGGHQLPRDSI